jgi:hypothetical protein
MSRRRDVGGAPSTVIMGPGLLRDGQRRSRSDRRAQAQGDAIGLTSRGGAPSGRSTGSISTPSVSYSSTKTWVSANMARTHSRCRRRERVGVCVPHGHWKTSTLITGLTTRGMIAPFVLDGPINRLAFETYVERVLVAELQHGVVVMDNPSGRGGRKRARGSKRQAPAFSTFRPIARTSIRLRTPLLSSKPCCAKAAERTVDGLWTAVGRIVDLFVLDECRNHFATAGYDAT